MGIDGCDEDFWRRDWPKQVFRKEGCPPVRLPSQPTGPAREGLGAQSPRTGPSHSRGLSLACLSPTQEMKAEFTKEAQEGAEQLLLSAAVPAGKVALDRGYNIAQLAQ